MLKKCIIHLVAVGFLGSFAHAQTATSPTTPNYPPTNNPGSAVTPPAPGVNAPATKSKPPQKKRPVNTKAINEDGGPIGTTNGSTTGANGGATTVGTTNGGATTVGSNNGGTGPGVTNGTTGTTTGGTTTR